MLFDIDKRPSNKLAAIDDKCGLLTYGELVDICTKISKVLPSRELVFCLCENRVESLAGFLALYDNKDVCLLLSSSIDKDLLHTLHATYSPAYYWMPKTINDNNEVIFTFNEYVLVKTKNSSPSMHKELSMLMTTSGTTGSPKLVRHKYGNIESNAKNVAKVFGWTDDERGIIDLPMQYTMGLNVITSHLYVGATLLLASANLMSPHYWSFIKDNKGSNFTGVPFSYEILNRLRIERMNLPFLTTFAEGGGKLSDTLFKLFADLFAKQKKRFFATFGTTETAARLAYLPPEEACSHIGSIGKAIPEGVLSLVDENGEIITDTEQEGELKYEGPNVTMGYATSKEDLLKEDEFKGIYLTGDIAKQDIDGYFYIVGRKKRFLKIFGLRVSLDQSEKIINECFGIQCACIGDDKKMSIFIENELIKEDVKKLISEKTGLISSCFEVKVLSEIPRFESGKINYKELIL